MNSICFFFMIIFTVKLLNEIFCFNKCKTNHGIELNLFEEIILNGTFCEICICYLSNTIMCTNYKDCESLSCENANNLKYQCCKKHKCQNVYFSTLSICDVHNCSDIKTSTKKPIYKKYISNISLIISVISFLIAICIIVIYRLMNSDFFKVKYINRRSKNKEYVKYVRLKN